MKRTKRRERGSGNGRIQAGKSHLKMQKENTKNKEYWFIILTKMAGKSVYFKNVFSNNIKKSQNPLTIVGSLYTPYTKDSFYKVEYKIRNSLLNHLSLSLSLRCFHLSFSPSFNERSKDGGGLRLKPLLNSKHVLKGPGDSSC